MLVPTGEGLAKGEDLINISVPRFEIVTLVNFDCRTRGRLETSYMKCTLTFERLQQMLNPGND